MCEIAAKRYHGAVRTHLLLGIASATLFAPACSGLTTTGQKLDDTGYNLDTAADDTAADDTETGGGDQNAAPVADAGDDQSGMVGVVVELDGAGSHDPNGDALDYTWTLIETPSASSATLINAAFVDPQFIPDAEGRYVVELVVDDGELSSAPDTVVITATADNGRPVANAGSDQSVTVGATVLLDGTGSSDPDGDALQFTWTMVSRPGGSAAALTSSSTANPSFTTDVSGTYQVSLTVSDGENYSDPDIVIVSASDSGGGSSSCGCHAGGPPAGGVFTLAAAGLVGLLRSRRRRA